MSHRYDFDSILNLSDKDTILDLSDVDTENTILELKSYYDINGTLLNRLPS